MSPVSYTHLESYYGDELTLFMDDAGEGVYDVEVKKNGRKWSVALK